MCYSRKDGARFTVILASLSYERPAVSRLSPPAARNSRMFVKLLNAAYYVLKMYLLTTSFIPSDTPAIEGLNTMPFSSIVSI